MACFQLNGDGTYSNTDPGAKDRVHPMYAVVHIIMNTNDRGCTKGRRYRVQGRTHNDFTTVVNDAGDVTPLQPFMYEMDLAQA